MAPRLPRRSVPGSQSTERVSNASIVHSRVALALHQLLLRTAVSKPLIVKFVEAVKAEGGKVGTVGFCWGGRYSILLVSDNDYPKLDAAVANHPSFLAVPDEVKAVSGPVLIQVGDSDAMMPIDQVNTAKEIFAGKQNAEVTVFPGAVHGFSVGLR